MRIIGGALRGRRLASLGRGDPAARLRPTTDRAREALFNLLAHGIAARIGRDPVAGARVLDLFAGTGALGLEALSRGAAEAVFVERGRVALGILRRNIADLGLADRCRVIAADATRLGPRGAVPCDLVFLDPPWGRDLGRRALEAARRSGWIAPGAVIAWEEEEAQEPPPGFAPLEARRWGSGWMTLLRAEAAEGT
ncbi:MAG: 16S rRNA (guanine(966)-N(2))-methyltransferase RsmD [Alphaproteobacteria bacterium]|nr:MAG: 16S rRNA (guanine(966)-N(2))-methyltransferase RsmD [Alphaproteobacteria bacterium]